MSGSELPDAFYHLRNFRQAIQWVVERNQDLLSEPEWRFASQLNALPVPAQALLARLSMRRGVLFRHSKIQYAEIEPLEHALDALIEVGWVDPRPTVDLQEVFRLCTKAELAIAFGDGVAESISQTPTMLSSKPTAAIAPFRIGWTRRRQHDRADGASVQAHAFRQLLSRAARVHAGTSANLQVRARAAGSQQSPFESREDIELFMRIFECYQTASEGAELPEIIALLPQAPTTQGWLRRRWDRLRYQL